jgi:hypothetical protein
MLGKVRPSTHRGNGSDPQTKSGLSEGRLALVHRYMIDAEEAEARARAGAEEDAVRARAQAKERAAREAAAAEERARQEAAERALMRLDVARLRAEKARATAVLAEPRDDTLSKEMLARASAKAKGLTEESTNGKSRLHPKKEAPNGEELAEADKRAARQAARLIAALEKKEARERRALAKAAARRRRG